MTERYLPGAEGTLAHYVGRHHEARYRWAVEQLRSVDGLVVDIACGAGYGSRMLAEKSTRMVLGIDTSPDAVAKASADYVVPNLAFRVGNAENLQGIAPKSVDALISFETIEHLRRPELFLSEIARVLKDDGVLLISTPNRLLASTLYPIRRRPNNPFHVFEYTATGFEKDVARFFVIDQLNGQGYVPRWLAFWPIQVTLKAICHAARPLGAYRFIDRNYHDPDDVEVLPIDNFPGSAPSILVARASQPRASV
jgi:SAM-dependent methyltransferase